ncbi:hypothetical protein [Paractinoplanes globisporus]|uniref:MarR family transcriptional regulator n=1 Tax=Paractinoplanes globisporus TaxID=113565 RepID=A0ABW6W5K3_9ACTN|nr:hypothetical protein [Actinoplanes globisporus]
MNPDDLAAFRCARLLLLLDTAAADAPEGLDAERIGVYDFLAAHPLLLVRDDDDPDRMTLLMAGFDDRAVAYASAGQRLATAQQRLARDLSVLVGEGLATVSAAGRMRYRLTPAGRTAAGAFTATYARSYRTAAQIIMRRLRRLSGRRLRDAVRRSLAAAPFHPAHISKDDGV